MILYKEPMSPRLAHFLKRFLRHGVSHVCDLLRAGVRAMRFVAGFVRRLSVRL